MDIGKSYGTDKQKEEEGVWVKMGEGAEVRVARLGNKQYLEAVRRLSSKHKVASRNNKLADEVTLDVTVNAFAEAILLEWKGIQENGKNLPYTRENAARLLKEYADFREDIAAIAMNMENFKREQEEATAKN